MPSSTATPPNNEIPLVVDLDGTLIRTDLLWESLVRLLRRNPISIFQILFWWTRGRALLKQKLAARVQIDPAALPYHEPFLKFLREQKSAGRKIILATASDLQMARPVADYTGLFDDVLGSDGKNNLRGPNKLKALVARFGERGFDYAGNSSPDLAVWRGAREAIVVNASPALVKQAANCAKLGPSFLEGYSPLCIARSFLNELFVRSRYLAAVGAGLVLAAAFPRPGVAGCAWVAPALTLACAAGKSGGDSFRIGYVAGLSFWLASLYWLLHMPVAGLPILGWIALSAYLALYPAVWVWLSRSRFTVHAVFLAWPPRLVARRRGGLGRARNGPGLAVRRLSLELPRRVPIPDDSAHSNRLGRRRLWRFVSGHVGFPLALFGRAHDFPPALDAPRLAGGNCPAAHLRHCPVRVQRRANGRRKSAGPNPAPHPRSSRASRRT